MDLPLHEADGFCVLNGLELEVSAVCTEQRLCFACLLVQTRMHASSTQDFFVM